MWKICIQSCNSGLVSLQVHGRHGDKGLPFSSARRSVEKTGKEEEAIEEYVITYKKL